MSFPDLKISHRLPTTLNSDRCLTYGEGRTSVDSAYYEKTSVFNGDDRQTDDSILVNKSFYHNEKRHESFSQNKLERKEFDILKALFEETILNLRSLESQIVPVKDEVKAYEVNPENKLCMKDEETLPAKKLHNDNILKIEREKQKRLDEQTLNSMETMKLLQLQLTQLQVQNGLLQKQLNELKCNMVTTVNADSQQEVQTQKLAHLKTELLTVRQVLDSSEQERLKERKKNLETIREMINLTKQKSDLQEKFEDLQKRNIQENTVKYARLFEKYKGCIAKLKQFESDNINVQIELQSKYLEDVQNLESKFNLTLRDVCTQGPTLEMKLGAYTEGKQNAEDVRKKLEGPKEYSDIVLALKDIGICQRDSSDKEVLSNLFSRYKEMCEKFESADRLLSRLSNQDTDSTVEIFKKNNRAITDKLTNDQFALTEKENELRITEIYLKTQVKDLLNEKKKIILECQKYADNAAIYEEEIKSIRDELVLCKETLSKRTAELTMLQDTLMNVTIEMQSKDATFGKIKRDLAVKDAEMTRLKQDILVERDHFVHEKSMSDGCKQRSEDNVKENGKKEKIISVLEEKVKQVEEMLETTRLCVKRLSNELDQEQVKMLSLKNEVSVKTMKVTQLEDNVQSLKAQSVTLEKQNSEKLAEISSGKLRIDRLKSELLATQLLLTEEDEKVIRAARDIEPLAMELNYKDTQKNLTLIEESMQHIAYEDALESSAMSFEDFVILDEKQPYAECKLQANTDLKNNKFHDESTTQPQLQTTDRPMKDTLVRDKSSLLADEKPAAESIVIQLEKENNRLWNDCLQNETRINTLELQLKLKEKEKQCLEIELQRREEQLLQSPSSKRNDEHPFKEMIDVCNELTTERNEKKDALECLKVLVTDNKTLSNTLKEQQKITSKLRKEKTDLQFKLNHILDSFHDQEESLTKRKEKLRNVMNTSLTKESNDTSMKKQEHEQMKKELEVYRNDKRQLQLDLNTTSHELTKAREELNALRNVFEYNLGSMDAEKRSKDFIEDQYRLLQQDRGHTLQKLQSSELLNKILQSKLFDLQKWHNGLEINLLKSRDFESMPLDVIKIETTDKDM